uniref:Uncharacterized protein n=1 Tax=Sphenodon punctatus TaxID=8508 RepID=A0A8D0HTC9_SPHPU
TFDSPSPLSAFICRTQRQQKIHKLEAELEQCQAKLLVVETQHNSQVEPLCKALEVSRADNKKLALSLDQALQANNTLQSKLTLVQDELDNKEVDHQQLMACSANSSGAFAETSVVGKD